MISNKMFEIFALPEIIKSCKRLDRTYFHLDGIGSLPHLHFLVKIGELNVIQWVPGDGQPGCENWIEAYKQICDFGKNLHVFGDLSVVDSINEQLGDLKGVSYLRDRDGINVREAKEILVKYAVNI